MSDQMIGALIWGGIGLLMVWASDPGRSKTYLSVREIIMADRERK